MNATANSAVARLLSERAACSTSLPHTLEVINSRPSAAELLSHFSDELELLTRQLKRFVDRPDLRTSVEARITIECQQLNFGRLSPMLTSVVHELYSHYVDSGEEADWQQLAEAIEPLLARLNNLQSTWTELVGRSPHSRSDELQLLLDASSVLLSANSLMVETLRHILQQEINAGAVGNLANGSDPG
jgi:hypothetical protein